MQISPSRGRNQSLKQLMERMMTTGNVLYLAMSIAMFVVFAGVLAYQSWQQSRLGPGTMPQPADRRDAGNKVMA
jgi:hypothetical protein